MQTMLEGLIQSVAKDGLPDMERGEYTGRVAFIFDGAIISGWPVSTEIDEDGSSRWEPAEGPNTEYVGVYYWVEFRKPLWEVFPAGGKENGGE